MGVPCQTPRRRREANDRPKMFVFCYPLWGIALIERFFGQIIANMLQDERLESVTVKFGKPGGAGRLTKTEKC